MPFKMNPLKIPEVILVEPTIYPDSRGYFLETFRVNQFALGGVAVQFVQENFSHSVRNTLRGLHCQWKKPQAKLVTCINGKIFDVAVDVRPDSKTYGKWVGEFLSGEDKRQLYIPPGFAHGFCVLSETADVFYKCSEYYDATDERGILWSDPEIGISWPVSEPLLSIKDESNLRLKDFYS